MGTITIYFIGSCTHFSATAPQNNFLPVAHRVVMVHKDVPIDVSSLLPNISVHVPTISILSPLPPPPPPSPPISAWPLRSKVPSLSRVTLSIGNAIPTPNATQQPSYDQSYLNGIFSLNQVAMVSPALQANVGVVTNFQDPAILYFDVPWGDFSAVSVSNGASAAKLTITTEGPPILSITPWQDSNSSFAEFRLDDGSQIIIANLASGSLASPAPGLENDVDFILNYLVTTSQPPLLPLPLAYPIAPIAGLPLPEPPIALAQAISVTPIGAAGPVSTFSHDIGPGCSNSAFP